jgi:hypothetical protein
LYGEVYVPFLADGLVVRFGKFYALPDIESPTSPSNYMYSHSMLNTFGSKNLIILSSIDVSWRE